MKTLKYGWTPQDFSSVSTVESDTAQEKHPQTTWFPHRKKWKGENLLSDREGEPSHPASPQMQAAWHLPHTLTHTSTFPAQGSGWVGAQSTAQPLSPHPMGISLSAFQAAEKHSFFSLSHILICLQSGKQSGSPPLCPPGAALNKAVIQGRGIRCCRWASRTLLQEQWAVEACVTLTHVLSMHSPLVNVHWFAAAAPPLLHNLSTDTHPVLSSSVLNTNLPSATAIAA